MANKAYRSRATGSWSNSGGTTWDVYSTTASGGVFPAGTWSQAAANDYPTTGDYVWIQSTHVITYDATAISANNTATFAQISNRTDINGSAIAQPTGTGGIGASNASSGYIALSVASSTTIASTYYSVLSSTNSLFTITASSTFTFSGTFVRGTTGGFIKADTGSAGSTLNFTGNPVGGTGASGQCIFLGTSITTNITGNITGGDGATSYGLYISAGTQTINITGSVNGSDVSTTGYGIASNNTNAHTITITGNVNSGQTCGAIHSASAILTANTGAIVTVTGNIRNYGLSGSTPVGYLSPIQAQQIKIKQASELLYLTTDGGAKTFTTSGAPTVTEQSIWSYLLTNTAFSTSGSIGKLIKDNLDVAVSTRALDSDLNTLANEVTSGFSTVNTKLDTIDDFLDTEVSAIKTSTDRIPTNPASVQSTGDQIATLQ